MKWQKSTNVFVRTDTEYTVLPQRLRTGGKSGTAANHWEVKEELVQCFHRRKNLMKNQAEV